jgi:hypothetical protein
MGGWKLEAFCSRLIVFSRPRTTITVSPPKSQENRSKILRKMTITVLSGDGWRKYEQEFKKYWEEHPVMHMKGSDRIITPPEEPAPDEARSTREGSRESALSVDPAKLFPERISDVFSDPAPGAGKVTLRPNSVARVEKAASGVSMLKPHWWEAFENYLQLNKSDLQAKCSQCSSKAA